MCIKGVISTFYYFTTMKTIKITQKEIQDAMKNSIYRNKKKYYRKRKHKHKAI